MAALTPSAVLLVDLVEPAPWYQGWLLLAATLMLLLTFARLLTVTARLRRQVCGEQVVREAVSELVDAHDVQGIITALDGSIRRLVRPGREYRVALGPPPAAASAGDVGQWYDTDALPRHLAERLGRHGVTLVLPLGAAIAPEPAPQEPDGRSVEAGDPVKPVRDVESLFVQADRRTLNRLQPRLKALAAQAGMALQRVRLKDQVIRQGREAYFRTLVQKSTDIILIVDDDNRIRYATPSAASLTGPALLTGVSLLDLVDPDSRDAAARLLARARTDMVAAKLSAAEEPPERIQWTMSSPTGRAAEVEISCRDLRADPSIGGLVLTLRDVTDQKRLERELAWQALHDPLTGLGNRLLFTEQVQAAIARKADIPGEVGVLYIDVDDLKLVNDGLGHEAGDTVLTATAQRLTDFLTDRHGPATETASRLGGDEFAVVLTGVIQRTLDQAASALTERLSQPITAAGAEIPCAVSVGTATTADAGSARDLTQNADLALHAAKDIGKRQWHRYERWMRTGLTDRLALRTDLEHAIDNNEFFLEYQPIVGLPDRNTVGFEALIRWQHPNRGRLLPDAFIETAEQSGLIGPIGEWALATAFSAARRWYDQDRTAAPYIAVNVSANQFRSAIFATTLRRLVAESGLPPDRVMAEITESLLLREDDRVALDLQRLRAAGIRVAIDDFGTGYSALSYLRYIPLDTIKLDRTFTKSMTSSAKQRQLVRDIVRLAKNLDLQIIAEGIETEAECAAAADAGCDLGQGYLFSPALPDHEAAEWAASATN